MVVADKGCRVDVWVGLVEESDRGGGGCSVLWSRGRIDSRLLMGSLEIGSEVVLRSHCLKGGIFAMACAIGEISELSMIWIRKTSSYI